MDQGNNENNTQRELKERIKELNCLYELSRLMENRDISENEFLQSAVNLIPPAWQYPEITCARLLLNEQEFKTQGFKETQWRQSANIVVNNKTEGRLDVFYLEEQPEMDEGPFLEEERRILDSFVRNLGQYLERKEKEEDLRKNKVILIKTQELANIGNWELDLVANHLSWSDEVYRIFGLKPQEFRATYEAFLKYVHPDDRAKVDAAYTSSVEEARDTYEVEHRVVRKHNGEVRHVYEKCYHERNREGKVIRSVGIVQDITEQKETETALRSSRESLRTTFNSIGDAVIATDRKGHITHMNPVAERLTGWSLTEAESQSLEKVFNIFNAKSGKKAENPVKKVIETGNIIELANDTQLISKNGDKYQIADSGSPIKNQKGEITGVVLVFRDVTEDYRLRENLKENEYRFRQLFQNMSSNVAVYRAVDDGRDFEFVDLNAAAEKTEKIDKSDILGKEVTDVFPAVKDFGLLDVFKRVWKTGKAEYHPTSKYKDNRIVGWRNNYVYKLPSGEIVALYDDVTQRKQAEERLRERERQLATLMGNLPGMAYRCRNDKKWTMEFVSSGCLGLTGYNDKQLTYNAEISFAELIHPDDKDMVWKEVQKSIQNNQPYLIEYRIHDKEGNLRWVWEQGSNVDKDSDGTDILEGFIMDITERKEAEKKIRKSEKKFRDLFNNINDAVIIINMQGNIIEVNDIACNRLGYTYEEMMKMTPMDIDSPKYAQHVYEKIQKIEQKGELTFESIHRRKDGYEFPVEVNARFIEYEGKEAILSVSRDVTERKQAEEKLLKSEEKFRDIFNHTGDAIVIQNMQGDFIEINDIACQKLGYTRDELMKKYLTDIEAPDKAEPIEERVYLVVQNGELTFETAVLRKDGTKLPVEVNVRYIEYEGKDALISVVRDISERKKTEKVKELLYNVSQLSIRDTGLKEYLGAIHKEVREIMKADNFCIVLYDKQTDKYTIPYFADEYDDLATDEAVSLKNTLTDYIRKTGQAKLITEETERKLRKKEKIQVVGTPSPVWIGAPIYDSSTNEVSGVIALQDYKDKNAYDQDDLNTLNIIATNIGTFIERINNLENLKLLSRSVEQNPVSIVITDPNGVIEYTNPAFTQITGYSFDEVNGENPRILNSGYHSQDFYKQLWDTILAGRNWEGELRNQRKNGELYWEEVVISPITDEQGNITHFVGVKEDITEKKKMIEDLKEAKEKAEESDRLKSAFLANMSHEIRTPMNSILGFTNLLMDSGLSSEEKDRFTAVIQKSGQRLMNTVNDIIEISKLESGVVSVETEEINANKLVEELVNFFRSEARVKGLSLTLDGLLPEKESILNTDKSKLESILTNLLKNAIKYTDSGSINVGCRVKDRFVEFYVKDTGIGVPENRREAIFNRFEQADVSDTRAFEGSGLGLAISKSYVEMLGGEIWLESEENKGSTFYFTLPLSKAEKSASFEEREKQVKEEYAAKTEEPAQRLKILVAEDDEDSFIYLKTLLRTMDCEIIQTITGTETVEQCRNNPDIDLILMDIKLPEMDGYEATRKIREFNQKVPIIAQTAYALEGDREKALNAGCDDYVAKPIKKDDLKDKIRKFV